jgi:hypothetical protein
MVIHQFKTSELHILFEKVARLLKQKGMLWIKTCSHEDLSKRPFNNEFPAALDINLARYPSIPHLLELASHYSFELTRQVSMCNRFKLSGNEIFQRVEGKHNSTLHLMHQSDLSAGLNLLKTKYNANKYYSFDHFHTLLELTKN